MSKEIIFRRQSKLYSDLKKVWERISKAYAGGEPYLKEIIKTHPSETDDEFEERLENAYYFNIPKNIVTKLSDLLFSIEPKREGADEEVSADFNRIGLSVNEVMKLATMYNYLYQRAWIYVDSPAITGNEVSLKRKKEEKLRPYAQVLTPMQVPDYEYSSTGDLLWAIIEFEGVDKSDPTIEPVTYTERILWTLDKFEIYREVEGDIQLISSGVNTIGAIPLVPYVDVYETTKNARPPMEDVVRVSDAITRSESELLTNILKQAYGLLVVPSSFLMTQEAAIARAVENQGLDEDDPSVMAIKNKYSSEISRSKCVVEDEDEKGITRYINPAGVTTESIAQNSDRLIERLYFLVGLVMSSDTTQRSSAESKVISNMDMTAMLQTKAQQAEQVELRVWELMNMFDGSIKVPTATYNREFSDKSFKALIMGILELSRIDAGPTYQKAIRTTAAELLNDVKKQKIGVLETINKEIQAELITEDEELANVELRMTGEANEASDDNMNAKTDYDTNTKKNITET